ncbi:PREDICTED: RIB43A-like with coiled-coils protein 2 [Ceratosolen solmsi marchali]|uniref:RIB43A-like with coiled-coils protein 2 n=1 Tax=Ceratosolen solmsi marchali TaxID=326594 RepID=A0AAJ7DVD2_9HYME|nr:PREDICTED: RIB43A-like with coiled-coils protein 2 [Ceratosolen solmsi marchali]
MLELQKCTDQDLKVAAAIEKKRQIEEQRKTRIFNPRVRRIGIDKEFLDMQVEEKKQQRDLERQKECSLDEALLRSSKLAIMLAKQQDEERRKVNKEIDTFRQTHQKPEYRRDFDLYDPELVKKTKPLRETDNDGLGPASAQKFEGEDANLVCRRKEQKEQMLSWIMQQVQERRLAEKERLEAEREYQDALLSRDNRAMALETSERDCRRRLNEATAKFNRALAKEKEQRQRNLEAQDDEDKRAEIYNHVTGDFLTESKDQAESTRGPGRPLANRYKGMTLDELQFYRNEQTRQMEEIQRMRMEENKKNENWDKLMNGNARAAESYQRELDRKRAELNKQIAEENRQLAQQHKKHQDYLNRQVYKNKPSSEFYEQFNKSTR